MNSHHQIHILKETILWIRTTL